MKDFTALHIHQSIISTKACPGISCQSANSDDQDYELLSERAVENQARKLRPLRYERGVVEGLQHFMSGSNQEG
jgi:hypothetical protein